MRQSRENTFFNVGSQNVQSKNQPDECCFKKMKNAVLKKIKMLWPKRKKFNVNFMIVISSSGFSSGSNEWRNTCTNCRCSRMCHDVSIGANCCGIDRIGFEISFLANNNDPVVGKSGGCHRTILAKAEGYAWTPTVLK